MVHRIWWNDFQLKCDRQMFLHSDRWVHLIFLVYPINYPKIKVFFGFKQFILWIRNVFWLTLSLSPNFLIRNLERPSEFLIPLNAMRSSPVGYKKIAKPIIRNKMKKTNSWVLIYVSYLHLDNKMLSFFLITFASSIRFTKFLITVAVYVC